MAKDEKLSNFLLITNTQSIDYAEHFLSAANWDLERAIEIFFTDNSLPIAPQSYISATPTVWTNPTIPAAPTEEAVEEVPIDSDDSDRASDDDDGDDEQDVIDNDGSDGSNNDGDDDDDDNREQNDGIDDYEEEDPEVEENDSPSNAGQDNLASLYRAPTELMYVGPFHATKVYATAEDKWLLINIQCRTEFNSHLLNRDTFSDESVGQAIRSSFVFWQVDGDSEEGIKVCTFYNLASLPAILLIDPITGRRMNGSSGFIDKDRMFDILLPFMDKSPKEEINNYLFKHPTSAASELAPSKTEENCAKVGVGAGVDAVTISEAKHKYPPLPEEPSCGNELICRVGIRLPDGRRLLRKFLCSDSIDLLWSFGSSQLEEAKSRPFKFVSATSAVKSIVYGSKLSFGESDLANSVVSLAWE